MKHLFVENLKNDTAHLKPGEFVTLTGDVICARDAAHKRLFELIENNKELPFDMNGSVIYYCGPTPEKEGEVIGSCGPTTSSRMDAYTPKLMDMGLVATIGKGKRNDDVISSIVKNKGVYFSALGGCGAIAKQHITKNEIIAFEDLGCEALRRLHFQEFPLIVAITCDGRVVFE